MASTVNQPHVVQELTAASDCYEAALISNDVVTLNELFWDSPHVVRFGVAENLYGSEAIQTFRQNRPRVNMERTTLKRTIVTFGEDTGSVTIEFQRPVHGILRHGRQSQMWRKGLAGWRVVSAHVSFLPDDSTSS